jgi:hypothetical protein
MKKTILIALLFVPALVTLGCMVEGQSSQQPADRDLTALAEYRQWTLVNPTPLLMEPVSAASCVAVSGRHESSSHGPKYISVFVNLAGREAMMNGQPPKFPVGSMIVKEKLGSPDSKNPEVLTAMIKREAGYNPESGDWEFLVLDGAASKITERGKLTHCSGCHKPYESSDFVTKSYLTDSVKPISKP